MNSFEDTIEVLYNTLKNMLVIAIPSNHGLSFLQNVIPTIYKVTYKDECVIRTTST